LIEIGLWPQVLSYVAVLVGAAAFAVHVARAVWMIATGEANRRELSAQQAQD